jgi:hypothetical protein
VGETLNINRIFAVSKNLPQGIYYITRGLIHENSCTGGPDLPPLIVWEPSGVGGDPAIRER